jgi:hypothetical protein
MKFYAEDPQILGATVKNLVPRDLCTPDYNNDYNRNDDDHYYYSNNNSKSFLLIYVLTQHSLTFWYGVRDKLN